GLQRLEDPGGHGAREQDHGAAVPNGRGSSSSSAAITTSSVAGVVMRTRVAVPVAAASSYRTWRQAPHGDTTWSGRSASPRAATATASKARAPRALARPTAIRSAHMVAPYAAFSTFDAVMTWPS